MLIEFSFSWFFIKKVNYYYYIPKCYNNQKNPSLGSYCPWQNYWNMYFCFFLNAALALLFAIAAKSKQKNIGIIRAMSCCLFWVCFESDQARRLASLLDLQFMLMEWWCHLVCLVIFIIEISNYWCYFFSSIVCFEMSDPSNFLIKNGINKSIIPKKKKLTFVPRSLLR